MTRYLYIYYGTLHTTSASRRAARRARCPQDGVSKSGRHISRDVLHTCVSWHPTYISIMAPYIPQVQVDVERGAPDGHEVVFQNQADESPDRAAGDLKFTLRQLPHPSDFRDMTNSYRLQHHAYTSTHAHAHTHTHTHTHTHCVIWLIHMWNMTRS